jgi:osmotically-inducible protein OsmY
MNKLISAAAGLVVVILATGSAGAQTPSSSSQSQVEQSMSAMDADLADRVRRTVAADRNLSTHAAKINIVASDGTVRLTGLVQNEGEKAQIASKAAAVAGQSHVVNDLRIMTDVADASGLRELLRQASAPHATVGGDKDVSFAANH